ncbi:MAG TPA: alpha/beta fold hydrolase [Methylomirabilota bacterium]|nr:alpha/beta fold hydrolase [Methylomirabilota bacterium]
MARRQRLGAVTRERFDTPDGDFVDVDWQAGPPGAPLLLVLHGLEGTARSHYIGGLFALAAARGWRAGVLYFRSCSGEINRLPRFYHSGDTGDLAHVLSVIAGREPGLRVGTVGISIGGNVLLKWLGELGDAVPPPLAGAVAISVPFDLEACVQVMDRGLQKVLYTASFMRSFRTKTRAKALAHPGFVDLPTALRARTFAAYDRVVTAPLHGFADELDYYRQASSAPYLTRIRRPTLLLNALDDPFIPVSALPDPRALPAAVRAEFVPVGGHVGFVEGAPWRATSWAERRALEFLSSVLDGVC